MYTIFQDHEGGLILMIEPQTNSANDPMFIYDGGDTALLFRDWDSNIRLNNISEKARPILKSVENIYIVEVQDEDIIRDYYAPVRIVRDVKSLIV